MRYTNKIELTWGNNILINVSIFFFVTFVYLVDSTINRTVVDWINCVKWKNVSNNKKKYFQDWTDSLK